MATYRKKEPRRKNGSMRMLIDLASDIDRVSVIVRDLKKMNKSALMSDCMRRGLIQVETELQNVGQ